MSEKEKYLQLIKEIRKHDRAYFSEARPVISDYEYDLLVKQLEEIEKKHPEWITKTSPTQRIGETASTGFHQVMHQIPMLSLANTYSEQELEEFVKRIYKWTGKNSIDFCIELKMDGVAISVRYEKGIYTRALTRGDGKKGDDITANLKTIPSVPLQLELSHPPDFLEIRGEVFMPHKSFREANQKKEEAGLEIWANPRNAAAGSLKLLDPKEVKQRKLSVVFYGVAEDSSQSVHGQYACHKFLETIGLPVFASRHRLKTSKIEEILLFAKKVHEEREGLQFDIDGIVVKVDDFLLREDLGVTGKSPRWAVAYKFPPAQATTKIREISVQVGRTGVLTPVAELEPVFLAGSTISRASLHNQEEIERKDIRVKDTVVIEKGGDVIPKVLQVDLSKRPKDTPKWKMPNRCPICNSVVIHKEGEVAVRCPNYNCGDQILRRLTYFASKDAMDIEHMGPKIIEQLVEKGLVKTIADIYALTEEEISLLDGFKEKSIHNLLQSIDTSRHTTLPRFILGLGIQHVGEGIAELLATHAKDIETLAHMDMETLMEIEGVGEKVAKAIVEYFQSSENMKEIHRLLHLGVCLEEIKIQKGHPFFGKNFVLTGSLEKYSRSKASELIQKRGGKVGNTVSKKTDYLVVGKDPGSKYEKAIACGVKILSEEAFQTML